MSRTLLAIISTPAENALVARHWRYFLLAGCDKILGCGTQEGGTEWPGDVIRLDTGIVGRKRTQIGPAIHGLVIQEIDIWDYFYHHTNYDDVCIVEADGVFARKLPPHPGNAYLASIMPDFCPKGMFRTTVYFQTPRWADRPTVSKLLAYGREMLSYGETEHWMSDRFPAWICYKHRIKFQSMPAFSPFSFPNWWEGSVEEQFNQDARAAIKLGAYYVHAVKTQERLDAIKDLIQL